MKTRILTGVCDPQFATIGNGITAIVAGWLGSLVRDSFDSLVAPFDAAILFLIICMGVIVTQWSENKGESSALPNSRVDGRSKLQASPRPSYLGPHI